MEITEADARDRADMERLAAGEDTALNDLMERHATPIFQFLWRMLGNEDDANDLAQETFARVFRARDRFRRNDRFTAWLYTIAANLARNQLRWRARHPNVSLNADRDGDTPIDSTLASSEPTPGARVQAAERAEIVRASVQRLPEDLREAIVLCEWEDLSIAEAATILDSTPKAVESRLYRARKILREQLKDLLGDPSL